MQFTRGDTQPLKFQRLDAEGHAITQTPTAMYFTVKTDFNASDYVFQKSLEDMTLGEDNYWHFTINPEDTQAIPIGNYVYDIEVTTEGNVFTISKGSLKLLAEATWYTNR